MSTMISNGTTGYHRNESTSMSMETITLLLDCGLEFGQCDILRLLLKLIFSVSIAAVVAVLLCIILLRKYIFFHQRILCYQLLSNLGFAISVISNEGRPSAEGTAGCIAQGYIAQVFAFSEYMWIWALTVFLFNQLIRSKDTSRYEWQTLLAIKSKKLYLNWSQRLVLLPFILGLAVAGVLYSLVCWGTSILITCFPFITQDFGPAQAPFCWIKNTPTGSIWRFATFFVPVFGGLWIILLIFIYMIWHANREINRYSDGNPFSLKHKQLVKDYLKPMTGYAAAFFCLRVVTFTNRVQNSIANKPLFPLVTLHIICMASYGIVLCTMFVIMNGKKSFTREKFLEGIRYYRHWLQTRQRTENIEDYDFSMNASVTIQVQSHKVSQPPTQLTTLPEQSEDSKIDSADILSGEAL